jgi:hypothetical protein
MPAVLISFLDGEIVHAETPPVTFELALLEAEFRSVDPNSERAVFAVSSIRQLLIGEPEDAPPDEEIETWDRAAFHFTDGQVLRARIAPEATLGRFGGVWRIVEPGQNQLTTIGIPYTSLKGVYRIRQWDSRPSADRGEDARLDQLARVMVERDQAEDATAARRDTLLRRMRRLDDQDPRSSPG